MVNLQPILNVVGVLMLVVGFMMLSCLPISYIYDSGDASALFKSACITMISGILFWKYKYTEKANTINKREGYLIVVISWIAMAFFSTLPYYFSGVIIDPTNAFFESMSGLTTTGASILNDIESVPEGILFWRSITQWLGGMGVIVLTVALFPLLGIGGIELFIAESPGPKADKIHPRIKETAKRLWGLYVGLTLVLFFILKIEGMSWYDSINHALTTMATGGFSTKNASIAHFASPLIEYTLVLFMFIAGMNYFVIYTMFKGRIKKVWTNEEFRLYIITVLILTLFISVGVYFRTEGISSEKAFRDTIFQVVSLITTTGYVTADYTTWGYGLTAVCFLLLFVGASAGSTAGGIKLIRHLVFIKNSLLEFKRILHPRAMIRIKINKEIVSPRILTHVLVFLLIYLFTFVLGTFLVCIFEVDILTSAGAVATCLGNVGPAIGDVGPSLNFHYLPDGTKWILSFLMLLGRLELFTVLVILTPYFWKAN